MTGIDINISLSKCIISEKNSVGYKNRNLGKGCVHFMDTVYRHGGSCHNLRKQRKYYIDVLKGIAMLAVILVHFNNAWNSPSGILNKVSAIGARCPQLFFIISAYLTWASLEKRPNGYIDFLKKKYKRMAPLYYIAILVSVLLPVFKVFNISIGNYLSHILFLNGLNPEWCNGIIGVEWYIADLALFYLLVPLLRKLITDLRSAIIVFFFSVVFSSISLVLANYGLVEQIAKNGDYEAFFHTSFIVHQLPVMIIGIILYYLIKASEEGNIQRRHIAFWGGIVTMVVLAGFVILRLNKRYMVSSVIAGLVFGLLFFLCSGIDNLFFENKVLKSLVLIGKHSYGIYCFHQIVINCVMRHDFNKENLLQWGAVYIAIALVSCLIGYAVEKMENRLIAYEKWAE